MNQLTPEQIKSCAQFLSQLEPGFLPLEIFNQIARLIRLPIVIVIPVKKENGELKVGLLQRDKDDLWWPNMWHLPGTVFRSTDTFEDCIRRLLEKELFVTKHDLPAFRKFFEHRSERGAEVIFLHSIENCEFTDGSQVKWFSLAALPEDLVESEKHILKELKK